MDRVRVNVVVCRCCASKLTAVAATAMRPSMTLVMLRNGDAASFIKIFDGDNDIERTVIHTNGGTACRSVLFNIEIKITTIVQMFGRVIG